MINEITKQQRILSSLALFIVGGSLVSYSILTFNMPMSSNPGVMSSSSSSSSMASGSSNYKDGNYFATGMYYSPAGKESIKVNLSLKGGMVAAANVISGANDPTASSYQSIFISGYKSYVIGKKINAIKVSNVSGSSLTSKGFNQALANIKKQAT